MPQNSELPILPMTAIDEITYRTPDALFNGEAVTGVIQSCVPSIKNAWATPSIDLDTILVAIRIASYGHEMEIGTKCPKCGEEHEFGLDLRTVIDNFKPADYSQTLKKGDLEFYFRPLTYKEMTDNSLQQFEQQKTLQMVNEADGLEESEKMTRLNAMMRKLVEVTVKAMSQSIMEIRTPDAVVSEREHIDQFLANCDRSIFNAVRDHVIDLREKSELRPLDLTCPSCSNKYQQTFTLDMASFFAAAS
jgi:bacterioferritin-associated ferredoxin